MHVGFVFRLARAPQEQNIFMLDHYERGGGQSTGQCMSLGSRMVSSLLLDENSRMLTRSNHSLVQLQIPSASERKQRTSSNYNTTAHNDGATQQLKAGVGVDAPLQVQVAVHSAISRVTSLQV